MVAALLATTNAGRVALASQAARPRPWSLAVGLLAGLGLIAVCAVFADDLLDALTISPESFRIAAGIVLFITGVRPLVWPYVPGAPFAAVLVTPELACLAISLGVDEGVGRVLGAAAVVLPVAAAATLVRRREPMTLATQFLAALQLVVGVVLVVSGLRDV
jgi:small neutral amino acid transporter SnatA (MarC family)